MYTVSVRKHERKKQVGKRSSRWKGNINIYTYVTEIGCERVRCIGLAQDMAQRRALVNKVMNFRVSKTPRIFLTAE
jgi:hypothetical protein